MKKEYDIEIKGSIYMNGVDADIKYPCGEVIESWRLDSFVEAGEIVSNWIKQNPYTKHQGCKSEYCN